jgi:broad specificity phosphatase PhoE
MDPSSNPGSAPAARARPARIIVVRHGRPALNRELGPRLDWREYREWWALYEAGSLELGQAPPTPLRSEVPDGAIFLSSARPRAMESAALIADGRPVSADPVFNEAPLPPPRLPVGIRYLPKTWNKIARLAWLLGHSDGDEPIRDTRARVEVAATRLIEMAGSGRDVVLAAHGWFNWMLKPVMRRRGWSCVRDGGDSYWSYRIYQRPADSQRR